MTRGHKENYKHKIRKLANQPSFLISTARILKQLAHENEFTDCIIPLVLAQMFHLQMLYSFQSFVRDIYK